MPNIIGRFAREVWLTVVKPRRIMNLFDSQARSLWVESLKSSPATNDTNPQPVPAPVPNWLQQGEKFQVRNFRTYDEYIASQRSKLDRVLNEGASWLPEYDVKYREVLRQRLQDSGQIQPGNVVLCLAARLGTEVKSFLDLGCFAIGIDLNPGADNKYVVVGDFHALQFPDRCVDIVFTNSLDHVLDIQKVLREVSRVLKPGGLFFLEAVKGSSEGIAPGRHESFFWSSVNDLCQFVERNSFSLILRQEFDYPWPGEFLQFRKP